MTDEGGVLENLPRSRPGQRSSKRSSTTNQAAKPREAKKAKPAAKKGKPASKPKPRTARAKPAAETPPPVRAEPESAGSKSTGSNPVGEVVRTVSSLAGGGARAARDVAREVLRRLPRP